MDITQDAETLSNRLISYLRDRLESPALDFASSLVKLQGGYETSIYRFELKGAPAALARPLVLRLYPRFYGTGNATWESTVQNILAEAGYPVARAHIVCTDMSVLGGAFFLMDHLPGQLLVTAPPERVPGLLGKVHAELHSIDPDPLIAALEGKGISGYGYSLASRFDWLRDKGDEMPWIRSAVSWLLENRPPEPERGVVCHGDFHALNILYADGAVTGVVDWGGFCIADPAYDVANAMVLITIPYKHLASSIGDFPSVDWNRVADMYLAAYRTHRPLDGAHLDYYRVRRCVFSLIQGIEGQEVWQHPGIVQDLLAYVHAVTGIHVSMPA